MASERRYDAVVFDLLTALINSWTLWNAVAGSRATGLRWRRRYLELTYQAGAYRPTRRWWRARRRSPAWTRIVAGELVRRWGELPPWPETHRRRRRAGAPRAARHRDQLLGARSAGSPPARAAAPFAAVVTAESVGYYKPRPETYRAVLAALHAIRRACCSSPARPRTFPARRASECRCTGTTASGSNRSTARRRTSPRRSLHRLLELV